MRKLAKITDQEDLGCMYKMINDEKILTDKTKKVLLSAEKQDPSSTEVLTAMAGYYTYTEDFEKAKSYCNRIIQKLPKSPLGYRKMAQLYSAKGDKHLAAFNYGIYHELRNELD